MLVDKKGFALQKRKQKGKEDKMFRSYYLI